MTTAPTPLIREARGMTPTLPPNPGIPDHRRWEPEPVAPKTGGGQSGGRRLRVAMFTDYYPPHFGGGVEKVAHELARGLAASDVDVRVFTLRTAGGPTLEELDGVAIHRSSALRLTRLLRLQSAASPGLIAHTIAELRRMRPDVIHAHNRFFFSSLVAAFAAQVLRIPLVTTLHLGDLRALPVPQRLGVLAYERTLDRAIIGASDRIVAVSQAVADYAQRLGATPDKTTVQPNAVDIRRLSP